MDQVLHYDIRNQEVAQALQEQGFILIATAPECYTMQAPSHLSSTKAKKIISTIINLYLAAKEIYRAQQKYDNLLSKIDRLNMAR